MATVSEWQIPLGLIALGALFVGLAWALLAEYRRAFFADPQSVMSIEVLLNILKLGGPGYLAMLALVAGLPMLLGGLMFLLVGIGIWAIDSGSVLLHAIATSLGMGQ
jgi:hypothetical protein